MKTQPTSPESPSISSVVVGVAITAIIIFLAFAAIPTPEYQRFEDLGGMGEEGRHQDAAKHSYQGETPLDQAWFTDPTFPLTTEEIQKSRADFAPISYSNQALREKGESVAEALLKQFKNANHAHFNFPSEEDSSDTPDVEQDLAILSGEWFENVKDLNSFVHIGDGVFTACDNALAAILSKVAAKQWKIVDGNLPQDLLRSEELRPYRESCGDALPLLVHYGLVDPTTGKWEPGPSQAIFDALQRLRFQQLVSTRIPSHKGLSPADQLLIAWWKTMRPNAFPPEERSQFLDSIQASLPSTPLADPTSPYYFNPTRARAYIAYTDKSQQNQPGAITVSDRIKKIFLDRCNEKDPSPQDQDVCNWLKTNSIH